ncbi:MAG: DsbA family oxidoreductase [Rhodospirillaceae bacterium]|nr:DsbA family oxidoreductase [Rhodospirillaceae bacterium]
MHVAIVSDTICPWCYIGKRRFERAQAGRPTDLAVEWRPFQLNPDMPAEGVDRMRYLVAKFGSEERVAEIFSAIEQAGEAEGIEFVFDRIARTPNTVDSHRLIEYAGERGEQDGVVEALFHRYFEQGEDIGDRAVLTAAGVDGGLDEGELRRFLDGSDGLEDVKKESEAASRAGISGVPCFIFEGRYAVSGAQSPDVFERVFELAAASKSEASAGPSPAAT